MLFYKLQGSIFNITHHLLENMKSALRPTWSWVDNKDNGL
jgi:hypothetical protein